jgi:hypothetical protein
MGTGNMSLVDRCNAVADTICKRGGFVRRQVNNQSEEPLTSEDWAQHGRVAAFLAFVQMGGNGDAPDTFDWDSEELLKRSLSVLQQLTLGSSSDVYDRIMRGRQRLAAKAVEELRWDAWASASVDDITGQRGFDEAAQADALRHGAGNERYQEFERNQAQTQLDDLLVQELTHKLKPQEAVWLIRRYRDGVPTAVLARELVKKDEKYQTADGFTRAVRCIDVAVHRARAKARALLDAQWHSMAKEVG